MGCPRYSRDGAGHIRTFARIATLVVALSTSARVAAAQHPDFRQLTPDNGLASSQIQTIVRDSRGFMWLGTPKGLNRYDGYNVTVYRHRENDSTSIAASRVDVAYEDRRQTLWLGTTLGLSRYDPARDAFTNFAIVPGDSVLVNAVVEARGVLWLGTEKGVFHFDRATGRSTPYRPDRFAAVDVMAIYEDDAGHIWFGSRANGAFDLDPVTGVVRSWNFEPTKTIGRDVRAFVDDGAGSLWVGSIDAGLVRLEHATGKVTHYRHDRRVPTSLSLDAVHALLLDGARGLWVGTENGGLDYLDFGTGRFVHNRFDPNRPSGLSSNSIWSLARGPAGLLWTGTYAGGVNIARRNTDAIRRYRSMTGDATSLSFNSVERFWEDAHGRTWVATDGGGLNRFDRSTGKFVRYTMENSDLNSDAVLSITEDKSGALWLGTWAGGISRFNPETNEFKPYTTKNSGLAEDGVFAVHMDRAGQLWIGTNTKGLQRFDPVRGHFTSYPIIGGIGSTIRFIEEASDGTLIIGTTERGLAIFDPKSGTARWYRAEKNGLGNDNIQAVLESQPGVIWVGTEGGMDRIDRNTNTIQHFSEADGLPGGGVSGIALDASHHLWVSGTRGLTRFDPSTRVAKSYTVPDGLQGSEFNAGASYRSRDGALFFGGTQGFNVITPDRITENPHIPAVALTGFQLFNKPVTIGAPGSPLGSSITVAKELVLNNDQSVFTLEFAALDYAAPEKNQYAYKLEGLDKDWNQVGTKRSASYTNLPAGHYVFRVRASNNDGLWNEQGTSIGITIRPPFWETIWFRTLLLLTVLAIVGAIIRMAQLRHRALREMNELLGRAAEHDRESQQYLERNVLDILGAMQQFSTGDYSVALSVASDDAIGKLRLGFNSVVADRKRAEEELRQSQKMEAVGRLAGGVAHDFNNLLTVIKGNAELALADLTTKSSLRDETDLREDIEEVERAAERASSLTRQLLAFSRKQILKPQTFSLNEMIIDIGRMLRRTVGEDIVLTISPDPALGAVLADPGQLEQVVLNLVVNARDAMPRGGDLLIETKNVSAADVSAHAEAEDVGYVAIVVTDTGTGMEPGVLDRVFEPFFTTKEQGKGTGLGLSTVYGSVKQSGGFVTVESELEKGSRFTVFLPRVDEPDELHLTADIEACPPGSATVLLVEDEDAVRRLGSRVLVRAGYTVITASCGEVAMHLAAEYGKPIDLLLTDVVMPGMSGRELAELLMPMHRGMRLLYASGYTEDAIIRHGVSSQQTAFLEKPFTPDALLRKVRQVLEGSRGHAEIAVAS